MNEAREITPSSHLPQLACTPKIAAELNKADPMSNLDSLAMHLIREGHWSDAVVLYRDELGVTMVQAEARVAALAEECGVLHPERWTVWFATAFAGLSLFVLAGLLQWVITHA